MTVSNTLRWGHYAAAGVGPYSYGYQILSAAEIEVYVSGDLVTAYSLTGVGVETGGTFTFFSPPPTGATIFHRGNTGETQQTDYNPFTGHPFTAVSMEAALDKLTLLVQELWEQTSRAPALPIPVLPFLRNLVFPMPGNLKLLGWNATGTALTLFDSAITQVIVGTSAHLAYGENVIVIPAVTGAYTLTGALAFPAGCLRLGAIVRVTESFGTSLGLTTFSMGNPTTNDRWGAGLSPVATAAPIGTNNAGMWRAYEPKPIDSGESVVLQAESGTFDHVGSATVTCSYMVFTAA